MDSSRNPLGFQTTAPPDSLLREVENSRDLLTDRTYVTSKIHYLWITCGQACEQPC